MTEKHFNDLAFIHVAGESTGRIPMIVYTDSAKDRDLLKVTIITKPNRKTYVFSIAFSVPCFTFYGIKTPFMDALIVRTPSFAVLFPIVHRAFTFIGNLNDTSL